MFSLPQFTVYSLWMVLVPIIVIACAGLLIGNLLRGRRIEDVDHTNPRVAILSTLL